MLKRKHMYFIIYTMCKVIFMIIKNIYPFFQIMKGKFTLRKDI